MSVCCVRGRCMRCCSSLCSCCRRRCCNSDSDTAARAPGARLGIRTCLECCFTASCCPLRGSTRTSAGARGRSRARRRRRAEGGPRGESPPADAANPLALLYASPSRSRLPACIAASASARASARSTSVKAECKICAEANSELERSSPAEAAVDGARKPAQLKRMSMKNMLRMHTPRCMWR